MRLVLSVLSLFVFGSASAQTFDELSWFTTSYPLNETTNEVRLQFAVPETDYVMASVTCRSGVGSQAFPLSLQLGAALDLEKIVTGEILKFGFHPEFHQGGPYYAKAVIPESGEGLYGVAVQVNSDDPLWRSMRAKNSMSYNVEGRETTLHLDGSAVAIKTFLNDCRS